MPQQSNPANSGNSSSDQNPEQTSPPQINDYITEFKNAIKKGEGENAVKYYKEFLGLNMGDEEENFISSVNTELKKIATIKEEPKTTESVMGK